MSANRDLTGHIYQSFQTAQATVSTTAIDLDTFGFTAAEVSLARQVDIYVNTNGIRLDPVNAPTVAQGVQVLAADDQPFSVFDRAAIKNLRIIRDDATDAEVFIVLKR